MITPNLYHFATSELSQDATLAYLLSWAKPEYGESHPLLNQLGEKLLREMVTASAKRMGRTDPLAGLAIDTLNVGVQRDHIDVWAEVNDNLFLVIEDKVDTCEHSDQISRYKKLAENYRPATDKPWDVMAVYVKTGNEPKTSQKYLKFVSVCSAVCAFQRVARCECSGVQRSEFSPFDHLRSDSGKCFSSDFSRPLSMRIHSL